MCQQFLAHIGVTLKTGKVIGRIAILCTVKHSQNSEWLNRKVSRSFMGVPCWIWVWYLHAIYIYNHLWAITAWKADGTEVEEGSWNQRETTINQLWNSELADWSHWTYCPSSTQWTCSHGIYVPVFLPNSSTHSMEWRFIYLVGKVDIGSMLYQLPDNSHISLLGCCHEGCLPRVLESN